MSNASLSISVVLSAYLIVSTCLFFPYSTTALHGGGKEEDGGSVVPAPMPAKHGTVVTKDQRWTVVSTEFGEISGVKVSDGKDGFYDMQFITMEPNSLFIPAHLHSDMVFYVNSGSGTLSWVELEKDNDKLRQVELRTGDVYRLPTGSFFYLHSNLDSDRRKFRINAIFSDSKNEIREGSSFGAYSSVGDLLLGFDDKVLQAALNVPEEVIQELRSGGRQPMIVHGVSKVAQLLESHYKNMRAFLGFIENGMIEVNKNKKDKAFNILEAKHDFENCNGWSLVVTSKQMDALKDSDFGIFMVNLTKGAMMGPHWNPLTAEIAVVLSGRGMVHVVCPSNIDEAECKNSRFRVEEGDVFVVPRYHPMAQISFNNGSFVFVGFTTTQKNNHPQYLVGSASVFQVLDKRVLAASLGVSNTTMDEILSAKNEAIILECTSCAEEEERLMEEEIQKEKEEEERKKKEEEEEEARREQEEARKKEEEEEAKREQEEAEAKRRQEEEAARRQEEEAEAKRRQEEEAARQQEEAKRRQEEEEEAARQQEEDRQRRQEEEAARQQEAAGKQREQEEEAETRRRQQEEAAARKQEEEADMRRREEGETARQKRQQEEEEEAARREQEQEASRQQEGAARRKQEQETSRQQEEAAKRQQEQETSRQQEEAMRRREEKVASRGGGGRDRKHQGQGEGEAASKQEEEMARREKKAEATRRGQGGGSMTEIKYPQRM